MPLFFLLSAVGRWTTGHGISPTPLSLRIEEKEGIKEEMEPVRQFLGGTSASLPNHISKNADVSIGVARSPLVKSANMAEVVSATPPKAPCRAPRARFGRGGIPKREGLNALTAAGPSSSVQTEAGNPRRPAPPALVGREKRLDRRGRDRN